MMDTSQVHLRRRVLTPLAWIVALAMVMSACTGTPSGSQEGAKSSEPVKAVAAPAATPTAASGEAIASFSGRSFTQADYEDAVEKLNPRARKTLDDLERRRQFVESQILSILVYEEGKRRGLHETAEIARQIDEYTRHLIVQKVMQEQQGAAVADEAVRAFYDANPGQFSTDRVKASHILVAEEALAKEIREKLDKDASLFAELAKEHSTDRSNAEKGGDLGFFGRGRMVGEFEEAAFGLGADGEISQPLKTRFGYHIIMRTGREDGTLKEFDEVKNQIKSRLVNEARRTNTEAFVAKLKADAALSINDDKLASAGVPGRDKDKNKKGK